MNRRYPVGTFQSYEIEYPDNNIIKAYEIGYPDNFSFRSSEIGYPVTE